VAELAAPNSWAAPTTAQTQLSMALSTSAVSLSKVGYQAHAFSNSSHLFLTFSPIAFITL
jgi:hypothetical protein